MKMLLDLGIILAFGYIALMFTFSLVMCSTRVSNGPVPYFQQS